MSWLLTSPGHQQTRYWLCRICTSCSYLRKEIKYLCLKNMDYNMVAVVVAMVISTMHEKSCIDSHNAREFEKSSKIQSFTHLAITMMKLRKYMYHSHEFLKLSINYTTQLFRKLCLTKLSKNSYLNCHWFHSKLSTRNFQKDYQNYVPFKGICVHNSCRFSDTWIILTPQRGCYARDL